MWGTLAKDNMKSCSTLSVYVPFKGFFLERYWENHLLRKMKTKSSFTVYKTSIHRKFVEWKRIARTPNKRHQNEFFLFDFLQIMLYIYHWSEIDRNIEKD